MIQDTMTLADVLNDPRIRPVAADAIRDMDLSQEEWWQWTFQQIEEAHFGGSLKAGFTRLFEAAESGNWYYPLRENGETHLVWFPSKDEKAGERPFILVVPGGGFTNVWNLTEGWPIGNRFNEQGYHVFILTYRVQSQEHLLDREMEDFALALSFIKEHAARFGVQADRYITCGFSAGGYLVSLWNVPEKGYIKFGLPKPEAVFPVYPLISWKLCLQDNGFEPEGSEELFGCSIEEAAESPYEIEEHAEGFPPCALFLSAGDTLVNPEHSRLLAKALEDKGIPCRLEIGEEGGHGFADGTGMCMEGWIGRAIAWYEGLPSGKDEVK